MSLNTAHANGGVLLYQGELILLYCDGVEMHMEGSDAKEFSGTKKGRIYLTSHRMIFTNKNTSDKLQSFCFPFFTMSKIELEQPIFGANYIKGVVTSQVGGNWNGHADFKLKFNSGGAIEFGQAMLQAARMNSRYMPPQPPPYVPHSGPYHPAQPPAYTPPPGPYYGFTPPTHMFPDAPPANTVFISSMPPPYPGISPPPYAFPGNMPPNPPGYGAQPGYGAPQQLGYGTPQQPGYGAPQQPGYGAPQQPGYGAPPPQQPGYAVQPPQPGFNPNLVANGNPPMANGAPADANSAKVLEAFGSFPGAYYDYNETAPYVYYPRNGEQQQQPYDGPPPPYAESTKKNQ